jgi:hypothetical protein
MNHSLLEIKIVGFYNQNPISSTIGYGAFCGGKAMKKLNSLINFHAL